jgi:hypothetical protein
MAHLRVPPPPNSKHTTHLLTFNLDPQATHEESSASAITQLRVHQTTCRTQCIQPDLPTSNLDQPPWHPHLHRTQHGQHTRKGMHVSSGIGGDGMAYSNQPMQTSQVLSDYKIGHHNNCGFITKQAAISSFNMNLSRTDS